MTERIQKLIDRARAAEIHEMEVLHDVSVIVQKSPPVWGPEDVVLAADWLEDRQRLLEIIRELVREVERLEGQNTSYARRVDELNRQYNTLWDELTKAGLDPEEYTGGMHG